MSHPTAGAVHSVRGGSEKNQATGRGCTCVFAHTCACARVCLHTHVLVHAASSGCMPAPAAIRVHGKLLFAELSGPAAVYFNLRQESCLSTTHEFHSDTSVRGAADLSPKRKEILTMVMILTTESRQKRFGSYKLRLLPHLKVQSVSR